MKKKLLSLLLVVAILMTSVSIGFSTMTAYSAGAVGGGAEAINAFSLVESNVSTDSASYSSKITVKSKLAGYKIRVNSIDTRCMYYDSSEGMVVTANNVTDSFPAVQGVTVGDVCGTEGKTYDVTGTTESAKVVYSALIRYECNYDLLNSDGEVEYAGLTGYGYGCASSSASDEGKACGQDSGEPGTKDPYYYNSFAQINSCYIQTKTLSLGYETACNWQPMGTDGVNSTPYVESGTAPSTLKFGAIIWNERGAWGGGDAEHPGTWCTLSEPPSGYYNFTVFVYSPNSDDLHAPVEMYYRTAADQKAALDNGNEYLAKNLEKSYYTEASWNNYLKALDMAQIAGRAVPHKDHPFKLACQNASDAAAATSLKAAVAALEPVKADYSEFNAAKASFDTIKDDTVDVYTYYAGATDLGTQKNNLYTADSVSEVEAYIAKCNTGLYKYQQRTVDEYTATIKSMTDNLEYADAVYTYLDIALAEFDGHNSSLYTTGSWNSYANPAENARNLPRDLKADSQGTINSYVNALRTAKIALKYTGANTTALEEQIEIGDTLKEEYNAGKFLSHLEGFTEAWNSFLTAYDNAVLAKNYTAEKQNLVDTATEELFLAIGVLSNYRLLDTSELSAAVSKNSQYAAEKYTTASYSAWNSLRVEGYMFLAKAASNYSGTDRKTYNNYDEMVRLTELIISAYNSLEKVGADFTELNKILATIPSDDVLALYKQEYVDAIKNTVAMIDYGAKFDEQDDVDEITLNLKYAVAELTPAHYREADYKAVEDAIAEAEALDREIYKNFVIVDEAIAAVDRTKNITQQAEVDAMAQAIRDAIANLEYILADYDDVEAAIAEAEKVEHKDWYANYDNITNIIDNIDWEKNYSQQAEVDAYAEAIREAIKGLVLAEADYSGVREAIAKADELDLSKYYAESVENLDRAISNVVAGYTKDRQDEVDAMAKAIEDAVEAMNPLPADYSKANVALARVEELNPEEYSNFEVVTNAVNALDKNLSCLEQDTVDKQVAAIYAAINELKYLPADYKAVDEAIEAAELACVSGAYPYTAESIQAVTDAIEKVDRNLDITQQEIVDAYIPAIEAAVKGLTYIRADYKAVDEALAEYNALDRDLYASLSELDSYVASYDKNITKDRQAEVEAIAAEIMRLIGALVYAEADYSGVEAALAAYKSIVREYYKEADLVPVDEAANSVVRGYKKDKQTEVDAMAKAINDAIADLRTKILPADLTELNAAVEAADAKIKEMSDTGYGIDETTSGILAQLTYSARSYKNSTIDQQKDIDALTLQIIEATENLEYVFTVITDLAIEESTNVTYIYGFEEGVTEADARELIKFVGAAEMVVTEGKNGFGTGTVIQFVSTKDGKTVLASYMVLVFGDVDGDSVVDMFDVAYLREVVNTGIQVSDAVLRAADVAKDGSLDATDVAVMTGLANMDATIRQDGSMEKDY